MMRLRAVPTGLVLRLMSGLMSGLMLGLMLGLMAGAAYAQDPQISVSAEQDEVVVGQPFILRVEVLVPTFMPRAPVFPTFEMPGLIVRLPERSTSPISRRIKGETWAGVQRTYRIYPMQAGQTDIPPQLLSIVYKDPESNKDLSLEIEVPPTRIVAAVPAGARTLDPLILARGLEIEQSWQLQQGELAVGDAVVRRLEVSVNGASALFVPPLLQAAAPQASTTDPAGEDATALADFLTYPEDAQVTEHMERGVMSGTRIEQVSYIAQSGGRA
ncbi:BatD family protein, partial [Pseudophaeobacter leonis]|uniref:BatD family protein n=1 Tax=Pseudophaeobacter leonis TaxID=1144477 RepID=UPI00111C64ED